MLLGTFDSGTSTYSPTLPILVQIDSWATSTKFADWARAAQFDRRCIPAWETDHQLANSRRQREPLDIRVVLKDALRQRGS